MAAAAMKNTGFIERTRKMGTKERCLQVMEEHQELANHLMEQEGYDDFRAWSEAWKRKFDKLAKK